MCGLNAQSLYTYPYNSTLPLQDDQMTNGLLSIDDEGILYNAAGYPVSGTPSGIVPVMTKVDTSTVVVPYMFLSSNGQWIVRVHSQRSIVVLENIYNTSSFGTWCMSTSSRQNQCLETYKQYCNSINNIDPRCYCINPLLSMKFNPDDSQQTIMALSEKAPCISNQCVQTCTGKYVKDNNFTNLYFQKQCDGNKVQLCSTNVILGAEVSGMVNVIQNCAGSGSGSSSTSTSQQLACPCDDGYQSLNGLCIKSDTTSTCTDKTWSLDPISHICLPPAKLTNTTTNYIIIILGVLLGLIVIAVMIFKRYPQLLKSSSLSSS
jgi:hypothetical protein